MCVLPQRTKIGGAGAAPPNVVVVWPVGGDEAEGICLAYVREVQHTSAVVKEWHAAAA